MLARTSSLHVLTMHDTGFTPGIQVFRKRAARLLPSEEEEYINFLTWTFELGTRAAARRDTDRWIAVLDMKGCAPSPTASSLSCA